MTVIFLKSVLLNHYNIPLTLFPPYVVLQVLFCIDYSTVNFNLRLSGSSFIIVFCRSLYFTFKTEQRASNFVKQGRK